MSKMWEALAPERAHAQWVNVWRVLALLRTYCPAEAAVERAISLCGRFCSRPQDIVETHVLSMCMALHSNLPPLQQWAKGQGVAVARHLAARARFDLRPRQRVSRKVNEREFVEAAMLQCLQRNEAVADDGDILPFFGGPGTPLTSTATPPKPDKGRRMARMQAKLVMAVRNGKLRDCTRGAPLHCLDVLSVRVAGSSNRRQMRDLAMQHALPLLAH